MTEKEEARLRDALKTINELNNLSDGVYAVREREGRGWEGPSVTRYSRAVIVVEAFINKREK